MKNIFDRFFASRINEFKSELLELETGDKATERNLQKKAFKDAFNKYARVDSQLEMCLLDGANPNIEVSTFEIDPYSQEVFLNVWNRPVNTVADKWALTSPAKITNPIGQEFVSVEAFVNNVSRTAEA